jgi:methylmalonyl-CoA mutase cobalamin-binding domain/chain
MHAMIDTCASIKYPMDVAALGDLSNVYLAGHPKHPGTRDNSTAGDEAVASGKGEHKAPEGSQGEVNEKLVEAIMEYDGEKAKEWTQKGLDRGMSAQAIVFDGLSLGMKIVGDMYERNERFVTDMLKAAKTMDKAMPLLIPLLEASGSGDGPTGTVVVGLVRGNTQDIGKNLVCLMLKANGFKVIDLGKNVKPEQFVQTAEENEAIAIGMSVMTNSSTVYVQKTKDLLEEKGLGDKYLLMCGGAAANRPIAREMGVEYGTDANAAVALVKARAEAAA